MCKHPEFESPTSGRGCLHLLAHVSEEFWCVIERAVVAITERFLHTDRIRMLVLKWT